MAEMRLMPSVGKYIETGHHWIFTPKPDGSIVASVLDGDDLIAETRLRPGMLRELFERLEARRRWR